MFYHTADGVPYWDESAYYEFTAAEIDTLEAATYALDTMCLDAVAAGHRPRPVRPVPDSRPRIATSSAARGRRRAHDLRPLRPGLRRPTRRSCWNTTPTRRPRCLEAAVVQWFWLQGLLSRGLQQFNSIHERLLEIFQELREETAERFYFAALAGCLEDYMTVNYLRDVAIQAGFETAYLDVEKIGWHAGARRLHRPAEREPDRPLLQALSLGVDAARRVRPAPARGPRAAGSSRPGRPC